MNKHLAVPGRERHCQMKTQHLAASHGYRLLSFARNLRFLWGANGKKAVWPLRSGARKAMIPTNRFSKMWNFAWTVQRQSSIHILACMLD